MLTVVWSALDCSHERRSELRMEYADAGEGAEEVTGLGAGSHMPIHCFFRSLANASSAF